MVETQDMSYDPHQPQPCIPLNTPYPNTLSEIVRWDDYIQNEYTLHVTEVTC